MTFVDSPVWIDYFNGEKTAQTDWLNSALGNTPITMGDLILTEVLQGFQRTTSYACPLCQWADKCWPLKARRAAGDCIKNAQGKEDHRRNDRNVLYP